MRKLWSTITHITHPDLEPLGLEVCDRLTTMTNQVYINRVVIVAEWKDILTEKLSSNDSTVVLFTPLRLTDLDSVSDIHIKHMMLRCGIFSKKVITCFSGKGIHNNQPEFIKTVVGYGGIAIPVDFTENVATQLAEAIIDLHSCGNLWRVKNGG